jgi:hypothetical protein
LEGEIDQYMALAIGHEDLEAGVRLIRLGRAPNRAWSSAPDKDSARRNVVGPAYIQPLRLKLRYSTTEIITISARAKG